MGNLLRDYRKEVCVGYTYVLYKQMKEWMDILGEELKLGHFEVSSELKKALFFSFDVCSFVASSC